MSNKLNLYKYETGLCANLHDVKVFLNGLLLCPGRDYILVDNGLWEGFDIIFKNPPGLNSDLCILIGNDSFWFKVIEMELIDQKPGFTDTDRMTEWLGGI